ncbi:hypothetical protein [Phenylobacterium aquaticum]|uniref:hypothetical protein n=1 Tax=Phenylobacterium aquaticum TaxID=1763816 RepID=UPI001F5CB0AA|nr:hypothetical protein [Phenylobacterium aquaticum]MCI3134890.1 hypothetical protein [Phenylobacterium aquaticum]
MSDTSTRRAKLEIGRVFSTTFAVVGRNLRPFALVAFLFGALPGLVTLGVQTALGMNSLRPGPASILVGLPFGLIAFACAMISQSALIQMTVADLNGQPVSMRPALIRGVRAILPLIGLSIVYFFCCGLASLFFFVPGVMLALAWCVSTPAYVIESRGIFAAFSRSAALTKGSRWRLLGLFLILMITFFVVEIAAVGLFGGFSGFAKSMASGSAISVVRLFSLLFSLIIAMLLHPGIAVLYSELRRIKDGVGAGDLAAVFD